MRTVLEGKKLVLVMKKNWKKKKKVGESERERELLEKGCRSYGLSVGLWMTFLRRRCLLNFSGPADSFRVFYSVNVGIFVESLFCWSLCRHHEEENCPWAQTMGRWGVSTASSYHLKKVSHGTITNQKTQYDLFSRSACLLGKRWLNHIVIDLLDWNKGCFFLFRKNGTRQLNPFFLLVFLPLFSQRTRTRQWYLNGLI